MISRGTLPLALYALMAAAQTITPTSTPAATSAPAAPGTFSVVGNTLVSAQMMFLGNDEKVYILDKAEGNPVDVDGHPAWGAVWDIASNTALQMEVVSNTFCASGSHLPNNSFIAFGGNNPVSPGPVDYHGPGLDPTYQDEDGRNAIRIITPCTGPSNAFAGDCLWFDDPQVLAMQARRWYSTAESLGDGSVAIIGGMVDGGYINRPNDHPTDPITQSGLAENTFEFYPVRDGFTPQTMGILVTASGLNTFAHSFLLASGKMFVQANITTILWDPYTFEEDPLPDMPNDIVRVYPASGGVAMLPMTPANNYSQTLIFCGGTNALTDYDWGGYGGPNCNAWEFGASTDCQRITPQPQDGSPAAYIADDPLPIARTMGQFILLPNGLMLMINGAENGTAGYTTKTPDIPIQANLPFGTSLATNPVLTPAIYNPNAPAGQRWSSEGLAASTIPRMYHSTAILMPDASVFVAGSNPNPDYDGSAYYPTESRAEIWYPPYWGMPRPQPAAWPTEPLTYGGPYFNITLNNGSYPGTPNVAASQTTVVLIRGGFTTHAMNMGQRFLQLNNTYTVDDSGDITVHVSQLPPNSNIFTPGPALIFVVTNGVPSIGTVIQIGSGAFGAQPALDIQALPPSVESDVHEPSPAPGDEGDDNAGATTPKTFSTGVLIAAIGGGVAAAAVLAFIVYLCCRRRARAKELAGATQLHDEPDKFGSYGGFGAAYGGRDYPSYSSSDQIPRGPFHGHLQDSSRASAYSDMNLPIAQHAASDYAQYNPRPADGYYSYNSYNGYQQPDYQQPGAYPAAPYARPPAGARPPQQYLDTRSATSTPYDRAGTPGTPQGAPRVLEYDPYENARRGGTRF